MPRIPQYNQRAGMQVSNPTGFQNSAAARGPDEELQNFGAAISNTAVKLDAFFQAARNTDKKIKLAGYKSKAAYAAYETAEEVKGMDPKERPKAFYESMQKKTQSILDEESDNDVKAEAAGVFDSTLASHFEKVASDSRNDFLVKADQDIDQQVNEMSGLVKLNNSPENLQTQLNNLEEMIDGSDIYDAISKGKKKQEAQYLMVDSAVNSMTMGDKPDFDGATKRAQDFIKYIPQERQTALFRKIEDEENQWKHKLDYDSRNPPLSPKELALQQQNKKPSVIRDAMFADKTIKAAFARDEYIDPGSEEDLELQQMALETAKEAEILRLENPEMLPSMAAATALKKYAPNVERLPKVDVGNNPDIDQNTSEGIDKAKIVITSRFNSKPLVGKADTDRYLTNLEILAARKSALRRREIMQESLDAQTAKSKKGAK